MDHWANAEVGDLGDAGNTGRGLENGRFVYLALLAVSYSDEVLLVISVWTHCNKRLAGCTIVGQGLEMQ